MAGTLTGYTRYIGVDINSLQVNLQKQINQNLTRLSWCLLVIMKMQKYSITETLLKQKLSHTHPDFMTFFFTVKIINQSKWALR